MGFQGLGSIILAVHIFRFTLRYNVCLGWGLSPTYAVEEHGDIGRTLPMENSVWDLGIWGSNRRFKIPGFLNNVAIVSPFRWDVIVFMPCGYCCEVVILRKCSV